MITLIVVDSLSRQNSISCNICDTPYHFWGWNSVAAAEEALAYTDPPMHDV